MFEFGGLEVDKGEGKSCLRHRPKFCTWVLCSLVDFYGNVASGTGHGNLPLKGWELPASPVAQAPGTWSARFVASVVHHAFALMLVGGPNASRLHSRQRRQPIV